MTGAADSEMFALVYTSTAAFPFEHAELVELAMQASKNNRLLSITGFLNYKKGGFLQYLEGSEATVRELMEAISEDDRHTITRVIELPGIDRRYFTEWHMRYWSHDELYQIKMVDLLERVLLKMKEEIYGEELLRNRVMSLVTNMAKFQHLYPERAI